jgi:hypothetical protein
LPIFSIGRQLMLPACRGAALRQAPPFERSELNIHWHVGQIIKLVSLGKLSHRSGPPLPGARLVASDGGSQIAGDNQCSGNKCSYGVLRDDAGREVFFAPELLAGAQGFDDLHRGQLVEFTFDEPFLRAASIHPLLNRRQAVPAAV